MVFSNKQEYVFHSKQRERGWPGKGQSHFYLSHHLGKRTSKKELRLLQNQVKKRQLSYPKIWRPGTLHYRKVAVYRAYRVCPCPNFINDTGVMRRMRCTVQGLQKKALNKEVQLRCT